MIQVDRQQFQVVATSVISLSTNFVLFQVGETAHLTCSVQTSSPPSELSWFINDEPVSKCIQSCFQQKSLYLLIHPKDNVSGCDTFSSSSQNVSLVQAYLLLELLSSSLLASVLWYTVSSVWSAGLSV